MRTLDQKLVYEQLELISHPSSLSSSVVKQMDPRQGVAKSVVTQHNGLQRAIVFLRSFVFTTLHQLTHSHEPRIWTSTIKTGSDMEQTLWHLYDPMTQQRATLASESEVRAWLDTRYYR